MTNCGTVAYDLVGTVECLYSDGSKAGVQNNCTGIEPAKPKRECPSVEACLVYDWTQTEPKKCSTECGAKAETAVGSVICTDNRGQGVADDKCSGAKPSPTQRKCAAVECVTYSWTHTPPSEDCSTECGKVQKKVVWHGLVRR